MPTAAPTELLVERVGEISSDISRPDISEIFPYVSMVVVPEQALNEAGYIRTFTVDDEGGEKKHLFRAMAQTACFLAQDGELAVRPVAGPVRVRCRDEEMEVDRGLLIGRTGDGALEVVVVGGATSKKLLEVANRYCTRWVRLDI